MKKIIVACLLLSISCAGCAKKAHNITASYVSPLQYQSYNCNQVGEELLRINRKLIEVSGCQDSASTKDAVALSVGLVLFWPALFFMIGGDKKEEVARLKGEYDAIEQVAIQKECSIGDELAKARKQREEAEEERYKLDDDTESFGEDGEDWG